MSNKTKNYFWRLVLISTSAVIFVCSCWLFGAVYIGGEGDHYSVGEGENPYFPNAVSDLTALTGEGEGEITLQWTSPGDDGTIGTAVSYIVKWDTNNISTDEFVNATAYLQEWEPKEGGTPEGSYTLTGFTAGVTYYFAIKAVDDMGFEGYWSTVTVNSKNWAYAQVDLSSPSAISDLTAFSGVYEGEIKLEWTAPGDDGTIGTASSYIVKWDTNDISTEDFENATIYVQDWDPKGGGEAEGPYVLTGFTVGVTYYFAVKAVDDMSNESSWTTGSVNSENWACAESFGWFDNSWKYRREISFSQNTSTNNYQVKIEISADTMGNPYEHVNNDGSDIRFTGPDKTTLQDYWIEEWNNEGDSSIWVEVKDSDTAKIYMYYGNIYAVSESSGDATFDLFDDFENYNIDDPPSSAKWTTSGTDGSNTIDIQVDPTDSGNQVLRLVESSDGISTVLSSIIISVGWYAIHSRFRAAVNLNDLYRQFWEGGSSIVVSTVGNASVIKFRWNNNVTYVDYTPQDCDNYKNIWYELEDRIAATSYHLFKDGVDLTGGFRNTSTIGVDKFEFSAYRFAVTTQYHDDIYVRKYVVNEPVASLENEDYYDRIKPCAISDLTALTGAYEGEITLQWTAPGDDGTIGTAESYIIKWDTTNIDEGNFDSATTYIQNWSPSESGTAEGPYALTGFTGGVTYYFAIKAVDVMNYQGYWSTEAANSKNWVYVQVNVLSPSAVAGLTALTGDSAGKITLKWTAPGEDGTIGNNGDGAYYTLKYATFSVACGTETWWNRVQSYEQTWPVSAQGSEENKTLTGFIPGVTYYFAIKTTDESNNVSEIDVNGESAITQAYSYSPVPPGPKKLYFRNIALQNPPFPSDNKCRSLSETAGSSGEINTNVETDGNLGYYQFYPGQGNTSSISPPDTITQYAWIDSNTVCGCTLSSGTYSFSGQITSNNADIAGSVHVRISKVTASGGVISRVSTIINWFQGQTISETPSTLLFSSSTASAVSFGENEYLMLEYYINATGFGTGPPGYKDAQLRNEDGDDWMEIPGEFIDTLLPAAITDLSALTGDNEGEIKLVWTAPGDDGTIGNNGAGAYYTVRYATFAVIDASSDTWWNHESVETFAQGWTVGVQGAEENFVVNGLDDETVYYFQVRTTDNGGNLSPIDENGGSGSTQANAITISFDSENPCGISDLTALTGTYKGEITLQWTAPGADGTTGTASSYIVRWDTTNITTEKFSSATIYAQEWSPKEGGSAEGPYTLTGFAAGAAYYFAIKAVDAESNEGYWSTDGVNESNYVEMINLPVIAKSSGDWFDDIWKNSPAPQPNEEVVIDASHVIVATTSVSVASITVNGSLYLDALNEAVTFEIADGGKLINNNVVQISTDANGVTIQGESGGEIIFEGSEISYNQNKVYLSRMDYRPSMSLSPGATVQLSGPCTFYTITTAAGSSFIQGTDNDVFITSNTTLAGGTFTKDTGAGRVYFVGDLLIDTDNQNIGHAVIGASPDSATLTDDFTADSLVITSTDVFNTKGYEITLTTDIVINGELNCTDTAPNNEGDGTIITLGGSWYAYSGSTFTYAASTVTFNGGADFGILSSGTSFYNLIIDHSAGAGSVSDGLCVLNNFSVTGGTLNCGSSVCRISGIFTLSSGVSFTAPSNTLLIGGDAALATGTFTPGSSGIVQFFGNAALDSNGQNLGNVLIKE